MFLRSLVLVFYFVSSTSFSSIFDVRVPVRAKDGFIQTLPIYDAVLKQGVPQIAVDRAFSYFEEHIQDITNRNYITIIDYGVHSSLERLYVIHLKTGKVEKMHVAHGRGSDADHDGIAEYFSNQPNSKATSLGFFLTAETYSGQHGYSLRLDGLSSTNSNARKRAIVIHGAGYVQKGLSKMGRSYGCPAVDSRLSGALIEKIKEGSLILSFRG